ncbi:Cytochrome c heme lyase subunit CcmF [Thioalkalivibrio nitratireducens DSM 14787]|uniref:Cytochrome c heme lyase subunit CcmF n=1 Tax=Thioalkalivibrio nitratireducens (strain DSM 14787 / UNIQEM 213 / ALEN2) TaxID=1255043 RepID=L0DSK3_THIND|nr:heme lyase CcmF/NrfE family subunit [Thioalkalivibrio nitratireducens]AGA31972.1 Cytochrome c heme lyase subunit CcmF [Thioalkalivibrio nitratireducens DSM 14787]
MIPELGQFLIVLALVLALVQGIGPLVGAHRGHASLMAIGRPLAQAQFVLLLAAFAALAWSFLAHDFSVKNVAQNSFSQLPAVYRFTATWGSHEGSLLLWTVILAGWSAAVAAFSKQLPEEMVARVLGVMGLISVGFLALLIFTSNPFERLFPIPADGRDLNPLLQDVGMISHPPLLYMGYVGFSVAFAFAIAALLAGKLDAAWARWSRPWTTTAWTFLTLGVALGSWWAYRELGWGGWWFWDPTENASLMPWLAGTALIHALAATEKRGVFSNWSVLLAIATFSLSLLGTFLVRSGVLSSVHAFATDPARGLFILAFLGLVIGGSMALYALRAPRIVSGGSFHWFSRESLLLANNVFLVAALGAVLLGTLYPLFLDALGLGKISVGPPYFNAVFVPLVAPALFLAGLGPLARWKQADLPDLMWRLKWAFGVALATAALLPLTLKGMNLQVTLGIFLALWILFTVAKGFALRLRSTRKGRLQQLAGMPRAFWGMQIAHAGLALLVVGVTVVSNYETERDVRMPIGSHVELAGYRFQFQGVEELPGPNYVAGRGTMEVTSPWGRNFVLYPEKRNYNASGMIMTQAAVNYGPFRDVYVSLGEPLGDGVWTVRVYHKPFVGWLWAGALLLAIGGVLAAADRRYRVVVRRRERSSGAVAPAAAVPREEAAT